MQGIKSGAINYIIPHCIKKQQGLAGINIELQSGLGHRIRVARAATFIGIGYILLY